MLKFIILFCLWMKVTTSVEQSYSFYSGYVGDDKDSQVCISKILCRCIFCHNPIMLFVGRFFYFDIFVFSHVHCTLCYMFDSLNQMMQLSCYIIFLVFSFINVKSNNKLNWKKVRRNQKNSRLLLKNEKKTRIEFPQGFPLHKGSLLLLKNIKSRECRYYFFSNLYKIFSNYLTPYILTLRVWYIYKWGKPI